MWISAATAYERALAEQPGDPNVSVDLAIAYFYSGQTDRAIETAERVIAESPEFGPAYFNAGDLLPRQRTDRRGRRGAAALPRG
jgi:tetratricopeptide (TPR) repeat protein